MGAISNALVTAIPNKSGYPTLSGYTNSNGQVTFNMFSFLTYTIQISGPAIGKINNFIPSNANLGFNTVKNIAANKVRISNISLSTNKSIYVYTGNSKLPVKANIKTGYKFGKWKPSPVNAISNSTKSSTNMINNASKISLNFSSVISGLGILYAVDGSGANKTNNAYDPSTNKWSKKKSDLVSRSRLAAGVVGSKLYAVDGNHARNGIKTNNAYNPSTNTWSSEASDLVNRSTLAVGVVGSKLYAVDGFFERAVIKTNNAYDPSTNKWLSRASDLVGRSQLAAGVVGSKLYAVDGYNSGYLKTNNAYDPSTNTWSTKASDLVGRSALAAGVIQ